jgi:branched-chain amino acid aminotransferase
MSRYQLFNGELYHADEPLLATNNRGVSYGDGFFESMKYTDGRILFLNGHWKRLQRTASFLHMEIPQVLTERSFGSLAEKLMTKNGLSTARLRFQAFRAGTGRYAPDQMEMSWSIQCEELPHSQYKLNEKGLNIGLCRTHTINPAPQSSFKTSNSLPYVLAGIEVRKNGWDDCLLFDHKGHLAEATGSNIFIIKGNRMFTPDLLNGGVSGVMRVVVLQIAASVGLDAVQTHITERDLLDADECFLTNAVRGPQWVGAIGKKRFYKRKTNAVVNELNRTCGFS